jgi:hypothetical protein
MVLECFASERHSGLGERRSHDYKLTCLQDYWGCSNVPFDLYFHDLFCKRASDVQRERSSETSYTKGLLVTINITFLSPLRGSPWLQE